MLGSSVHLVSLGDEQCSTGLKMVAPGDRLWVNVPGAGYVGVARVVGHATPAADFRVLHNGEERPALEVLQADYHRELVDDPERCEYFVSVEWLYSLPLNEAVKEIGLFGNQNTICRPTTPKWRWTVERLKERFKWDYAQQSHSVEPLA